MKFRTEVDIIPSILKIEKTDKIFSIGSCFATEMTELLSNGQLQCSSNPFGTLFNPYSINTAIQKLVQCIEYQPKDLIKYEDTYISLDHHTSFNSASVDQTLERINAKITRGNEFLQQTKWVIITYGSAFVYRFLPKDTLVGNCHKIPGKFFEKRMLTHDELVSAMKTTVQSLTSICGPDVQVLFSISPVRHSKDGMQENMLSKAKLITAVHEVVTEVDGCHYLPVFEMMMDDLRDYRFYKEDMIHPSQQAVQYIFEKFGNAYFSDDTMDFILENFKIHKSLQHRVSDENNVKYKAFLQNLNAKIHAQQQKVNHRIFPTVNF